MKIKDLKLKSETELQKMLSKERASLRDLRWQVFSDQHKKVREVRTLRKLIARILTLLNNKDLLKKSDKEKDVKSK